MAVRRYCQGPQSPAASATTSSCGGGGCWGRLGAATPLAGTTRTSRGIASNCTMLFLSSRSSSSEAPPKVNPSLHPAQVAPAHQYNISQKRGIFVSSTHIFYSSFPHAVNLFIISFRSLRLGFIFIFALCAKSNLRIFTTRDQQQQQDFLVAAKCGGLPSAFSRINNKAPFQMKQKSLLLVY